MAPPPELEVRLRTPEHDQLIAARHALRFARRARQQALTLAGDARRLCRSLIGSAVWTARLDDDTDRAAALETLLADLPDEAEDEQVAQLLAILDALDGRARCDASEDVSRCGRL